MLIRPVAAVPRQKPVTRQRRFLRIDRAERSDDRGIGGLVIVGLAQLRQLVLVNPAYQELGLLLVPGRVAGLDLCAVIDRCLYRLPRD